jgi:CxxC motif-containing protein (DUF1111 family)
MRKLAKHWVRRLTVGQIVALLLLVGPLVYVVAAQESAPGEPRGGADDGFFTTSNGFLPTDVFKAARTAFSSRDKIADGLGPVYNAQSCSDCHQNPITGGGSQVTELRAARFKSGVFEEKRADGSLIQDRAINSLIQEIVFSTENVRSRRISPSTLGDGYIEAITDINIRNYRNTQPLEMQGYLNDVPVFEAPGTTRVGRFGWKAQHASLLSFSAQAYHDEIGITSRLFPDESLSNDASVTSFDQVLDPEDKAIIGAYFGEDVHKFADFIRSTQHPEKLLFTADAAAGEVLFTNLRCSVCHRRSYTTALPGTVFNPSATDPSGQFIVDGNLGSREIYPYSDFLLHDVGTGDNIQQGPPETLTRFRTPPLWGLRARNRLMHDGASFTPDDAILRHGGQATISLEGELGTNNQGYKNLTTTQKNQLLAFLASI